MGGGFGLGPWCCHDPRGEEDPQGELGCLSGSERTTCSPHSVTDRAQSARVLRHQGREAHPSSVSAIGRRPTFKASPNPFTNYARTSSVSLMFSWEKAAARALRASGAPAELV